MIDFFCKCKSFSFRKLQEHILLRELMAAHPDEFSRDSTTLEQLVRMQHYKLPTRLLDVTFNPLVALYFATEENKKRKRFRNKDGTRKSLTIEAKGKVQIINVHKSDVTYFDSDTVSCLANLAKLRPTLKENIDTSLDIDSFNEELEIKRLTHFIRQEKNQFEAEIEPDDLDKILLVKPKQSNKRILAQNGAFFIFGLTETLDEETEPEVEFDEIMISGHEKKNIRNQLDILNINEMTMFPEIERAANYLNENTNNSSLSGLKLSS